MTDETPAHDAGRLRRAWALVKSGRVERLGGTQFKIAGNDEPSYSVDLAVDPPCYCADMWYRGRKIRNNCKHTLAGRLALHDPALLLALIEMMTFEDDAAPLPARR